MCLDFRQIVNLYQDLLAILHQYSTKHNITWQPSDGEDNLEGSYEPMNSRGLVKLVRPVLLQKGAFPQFL